MGLEEDGEHPGASEISVEISEILLFRHFRSVTVISSGHW